MSYRAMSNREGNQQRIMEMHAVGMSPGVIAAYMSDWRIPMSAQDVQTIIKVYEPMGRYTAKKDDVQHAIQTHQQYIEPWRAQQPAPEREENVVDGLPGYDEEA
jgi:hypothetical protein